MEVEGHIARWRRWIVRCVIHGDGGGRSDGTADVAGNVNGYSRDEKIETMERLGNQAGAWFTVATANRVVVVRGRGCWR